MFKSNFPSHILGGTQPSSPSSLALTFLAVVTIGCTAADRGHEESVAKVRQHLETGKPARVSVLLTDREVVAAQSDITTTLAGTGATVVHAFSETPGMALEITSQAALDLLASHTSVERFDLSAAGGGGLLDSRGIVGAEQAASQGLTGAGRLVTILDTGIDLVHQDLTDDLLDEACICNTGADCCPGGGNQQFGAGAAADDHGHGTHVSGIVTSAGIVAPTGIAPDTSVVVVRMMNNNSFSSVDDITASLEWVLANHPESDAVNMSLQTAQTFQANCDLPTATYTPPSFVTNLANVVQSLRNVGVTTVSISGNFSNKSATSLPGCLSNVINTGNTTKQNEVNSSSNSDEGLDVLAPGTNILSTFPTNSETSLTGTSMAAPHVAAAVSILRQADPSLSPDEVVGCLTTSPIQITDTNGIERPLLSIPDALAACGIKGPECDPTVIEAESMEHSVGGPVPYGWNLWSDGDISTTHDFSGGPSRLVVRARGEQAAGTWPHMVVSIDGNPIGDVTVASAVYSDYEFTFEATSGPAIISIAFDNDFYQPPADRNLIVDEVLLDCEPASSGLNVELSLATDWGQGYCMSVLITNAGNAATNSWQATLDLQGTQITDLWNGNYTADTGLTTLTPVGWNAVLAPGETNPSIGFCASRPEGVSYLATVVSATAL